MNIDDDDDEEHDEAAGNSNALLFNLERFEFEDEDQLVSDLQNCAAGASRNVALTEFT